jgi:hypothetical protein
MFDRNHPSIMLEIYRTAGIRPPERKRSVSTAQTVKCPLSPGRLVRNHFYLVSQGSSQL